MSRSHSTSFICVQLVFLSLVRILSCVGTTTKPADNGPIYNKKNKPINWNCSKTQRFFAAVQPSGSRISVPLLQNLFLTLSWLSRQHMAHELTSLNPCDRSHEELQERVVPSSNLEENKWALEDCPSAAGASARAVRRSEFGRGLSALTQRSMRDKKMRGWLMTERILTYCPSSFFHSEAFVIYTD